MESGVFAGNENREKLSWLRGWNLVGTFFLSFVLCMRLSCFLYTRTVHEELRCGTVQCWAGLTRRKESRGHQATHTSGPIGGPKSLRMLSAACLTVSASQTTGRRCWF